MRCAVVVVVKFVRAVMALAALAGLAALAAASALFGVPDAHASAVTYADGAFARIASERAVVVWDAARQTEHLLLDVTFDADARDFGLLVPVPAAASIAKDDDARIDAAASLASANAKAAASGDRLYAFEVSTIRDAGALAAWLAKRGHVPRANVTTWAQAYFARGLSLAAIAYVATKTERRAWRVPALRFSFATDAPSFPYAEPAPDAKDESDFARRVSASKDDAAPRTLDLWAIAPGELHASGGRAGGLAIGGGRAASSDALARALGDVGAWGFDARARDTWFVTRFEESAVRRVGSSDFTFAPGWPTAARTGPAAPARSRSEHAGLTSRRALFVLVALGLLFAATALVLDRRGRGP